MIRYMCSTFFFLLLLMFCVSSEATHAEQEDNLDPAKLKGIIGVKNNISNLKVLNILNLSKASFVSVADTIVALVQTKKENEEEKILIKCIGPQEEGNWGKESTITGKNQNLPTGFKWENKEEVALAMVAKDDQIYIFAASKPQPIQSDSEATAQQKKWNLKFAVGTINSNGSGQAEEKTINWVDKSPDIFSKVEKVQDKLKDVSPVDAFAFLTENGELVFVVRSINKNNKKSFVVAHSKNTRTDFEVSFVDVAPNCFFSFFSWGTKLFMVPEFCENITVDKIPKIQQSTDMGKTWTDANGPLATNLNNLKGGKSFFTTTTIDSKPVVLFTLEKIETDITPENDNTNLFMSNDKCIIDLGPIISNVLYVPFGSIVHTKDELFFFGQRILNSKYKIVVERLKTQLDTITATLKESECVEGKKEGSLDVPQEDHSTQTTPQEDTTQLRESGDSSVNFRAHVTVVLLLLCVLLGF